MAPTQFSPFRFEGICPFQEISGMGLEAESGLRIIDCACQLKGTAGLRA